MSETGEKWPVLPDRPAEFLVSSESSFDNYLSERKRRRFQEWAAFYDDLKAHYDCWEIEGTRRKEHWSGLPIDPEFLTFKGFRPFGRWGVRIWDLRRRIEDREPRVTPIDASSFIRR